MCYYILTCFTKNFINNRDVLNTPIKSFENIQNMIILLLFLYIFPWIIVESNFFEILRNMGPITIII